MDAVNQRIDVLDREIAAKDAKIEELQAQWQRSADPAFDAKLQQCIAQLQHDKRDLLDRRSKLEDKLAAAAVAQPPAALPDSYLARLNMVPTPNRFAAVWPDFQDMGEDHQDPLFHCLRPSSARGTSPTLMHPAFGKFLDLAASAPVDDVTAQILVRLIRDMSASYMDTTSENKLRTTQRVFGGLHEGVPRGQEATRAQTLRRLLLELMQSNMRNWPPTLEPAAVSLETSQSQTDGSLCIINSITGKQIAQVVIIEVKEDDGAASMQLLAYYARLVRDVVVRQAPAALHTCLPALGIEVIGNMFRVHALYYAEKVSSEPLTPMLHLSDMRMSVPGYNEMVARVLVALVQTADNLWDEYAGFMGPQQRPVPGATRGAELAAGIPYMLRNRFAHMQRLNGNGQVYLCEDAEGGKLVAKVLPMRPEQYPSELHKELWRKGLAPEMLALEGYNGGFSLVEMEYLDPGKGWVALDRFTGNTQALREACGAALKGLHSCLSGHAVHGDVRIPNIFVREEAVPGSSMPQVQVCFIDLDWSGQSGEVQYPIFKSSKEFPWSLGPILQEHDVAMLDTALRKAEERRPQQHGGGMGLQAGGEQAPQPRRGLPRRPRALGQAPAAVLQRAHHMRPKLAAPCLTRATHVVAVRPHLPGTRAPGSHRCNAARVGMFGGAP